MASDASTAKQLALPVLTALKNEAAAESAHERVPMARSFSQDIEEGRRELKEAAEQTQNIILDLDLEGIIRWVSPSWTDVVGDGLEAVKQQPISKFILDKPDIFARAIETLKSHNSKSQYVKFAIKVPHGSDLDPMLSEEQKDESQGDKAVLELDGQGIMVYDRATGDQSHVSRP